MVKFSVYLNRLVSVMASKIPICNNGRIQIHRRKSGVKGLIKIKTHPKILKKTNEPGHSNSYKTACPPSEYSDQRVHSFPSF